MSDRSYLQHGRRHHTTGSDPIPGFGQVLFASLRISTPATVPGDAANHYIDMQDGVTGHFATSDANIFENAANTDLSGDPYGIECHAEGTYIIRENYFVSGGTGGVQVITYHVVSDGIGSTFQFGRTGALVGDTWDAGSSDVHTSFEEWTSAVDTDTPFFINPYLVVASGSDVTVNVQTMVIFLGAYTTDQI